MKAPHPPCRPKGTERADDLLSLEPEAMARRRLMIGMSDSQQDACLVGQPAPRVARMWERMSHPQPGDLVVETGVRRGDYEIHGIGILLAHCQEFYVSDLDWAAEVAQYGYEGACDLHGRRPSEETWYVQYGPHPVDVARWTNADMRAVLTDRRGTSPDVGERTETGGVMLTRDDIVGALSDSGFTLRQPPGKPVIRCRACGNTWRDEDDTTCTCTDSKAPGYEDWVVT